MEVLAGVLAGARFGTEHTPEVERGPVPWDEGHCFMALDPGLFMPRAQFLARVDELVRQLHAIPAAQPGGRVRVPGELGWERRERALREGVLLPASVYDGLKRLTHERGLRGLRAMSTEQ
jgi:L-2-hydroxycarboxylate dehydrogenase (NAD+)